MSNNGAVQPRVHIEFTHDTLFFNNRVVAIIFDRESDGRRVLTHDDGLGAWVLPGGRGELTEFSDVSVAREMAEELGYEVTVERLVFVVERTFGFLHWDRGNIPCTVHQIAFYYLCTLPPNCPLSDLTVPFTSPEPGNLQTYKWQDVASLPDINLKPDFLRTALQHLPDGITRVTERA